MKMYIFVCAFDDSGLDVEVQGVYKSEEKAIEGMMDYFVDTCNYNEDDAKDVVNELLIERYGSCVPNWSGDGAVDRLNDSLRLSAAWIMYRVRLDVEVPLFTVLRLAEFDRHFCV